MRVLKLAAVGVVAMGAVFFSGAIAHADLTLDGNGVPPVAAHTDSWNFPK
ncbi:hypothetical protein [Streptosporangium carneum]|uniref:Uncharacterized protein n=1 Tax=Streptosporangium carneum TaxID=47481 RepID=A0A9W6I5B8_9ACTN|nr:hypothetical protein [Streptosporangium carneum]GLK11239.1 hypothetical protein GCM10017600_46450 [Streptosporangium carneum]